MKTSLLSLILALCMILSVCTIASTAEEASETVTIKRGQKVKYTVTLQMEQGFGAIDGRFFFDPEKFGLVSEVKEANVIYDPATGEKLYSEEKAFYDISFPGAGLNDGTKDGDNLVDYKDSYFSVVTNFREDQLAKGEICWNYIATVSATDSTLVGFDYSDGVELMVAVVEAKEDITCTTDDLHEYIRFGYEEIIDVNWKLVDFFGDANGKIDIEILD